MNPLGENSLFPMNFSMNIKGELYQFDHAIVMGILNVTPDSFYDGGKYTNEKEILKQVERIKAEGATILDIGAFSSRPGAKMLDEKEELGRLIPVLKILSKIDHGLFISIDTYRRSVAELAISHGAHIINDITAGEWDKKLPEFIAEVNVPYVIMHMQGKPETMQNSPSYNNVTKEIFQWLSEKYNRFTKLGLKDIIIDPGFGFGKTLEHNYQLLKDLQHFKTLNCPILVGISRKGMIQKVINTTADNALNGSTAAHVLALMNGANIIRAHDVKQAKEAIAIVDYYQKQ